MTEEYVDLKEVRKERALEPRIKLLPFDQITLDCQRRYLVKGLIPRTGLTVIWGAPKSGKSFWTFDVLMHVALGWDYRGRRVDQGPVVYCAFEGATGFRARIEAFRSRFLPEDAVPVPFYLVPITLDLVSDHKELISAIRSELGDAVPHAVSLDTLNRSLRGSENSDQDMGAYVKAADAIRETFDCSIPIVHHCGIDETRPRGHTSLRGALEAQLVVKRGTADTIFVTVEEMKEGPSGETVACELEQVEVGLDEDGEPITSCVVITSDLTEITPLAGPKLSPNQRSMWSILEDAGAAGLTLEEWHEQARANGLGVPRRTSLMDYRKALRDKKLIHTYADRWYVTR